MPFETFIVVGQMSRSDGLDKLFLDNLLVPIGRVICKPLSRRITEDYTGMLNPLPDDTILDWSKLKQIADDI